MCLYPKLLAACVLALTALTAQAGLFDDLGTALRGTAKKESPTTYVAQPADKASDTPNRTLAVAQTNNAVSEQRIALVIGNGAYTNTPLKNPVNDARDVAVKLRGLGFSVIERTNLRKEQIGGMLREFRSKLKPGAVALVFYAGHGLQIKGINYLPAIDANINSEEDVPYQSLAVRQIMDVLDEAKTRLNLVFLDACRNNPYARSFRSAETGLARVVAPSGTLISYATRPGSVAADGDGRNGLYTSKLLKQMDSNLQIELALKRVVSEVKAASQGNQEPWMEGSIEGDFCFAGCAAGGGTQIANLEPVPTPTGGDFSLDDIKKQQETRGQWDKWQVKMKADFEQAVAFTGAAELQVAVWDRFLANYAQDNPYSAEDEQLRAQAQNNKQSAQAQQQQAAARLEQQRQEAERLKQQAEAERQRQQAQAARPQQTSGNEPEMVRIPGRSYELGKYEVTQKEWRAVMGGNPSNFTSCGDTCPVEQVSWNDIQEFIQKLNQKTGKQYRLPSEAEWEYACYGGSQTEYCGSNNIDAVAWYHVNSGEQTHPVGQKQANGYGLYDMSGNVLEWMSDCYASDCAERVLRLGSWYDGPRFGRAANRLWEAPAYRNYNIGFRLARTLPSEVAQLVANSTAQTELPKGFVSQDGITWMPVTFYKPWSEANSYCAHTMINGQSGWRLPTKDELVALYNSSKMKNQGWTLFGTWSSTPGSSGSHYDVVGLDDGLAFQKHIAGSSFVTCVR